MQPPALYELRRGGVGALSQPTRRTVAGTAALEFERRAVVRRTVAASAGVPAAAGATSPPAGVRRPPPLRAHHHPRMQPSCRPSGALLQGGLTAAAAAGVVSGSRAPGGQAGQPGGSEGGAAAAAGSGVRVPAALAVVVERAAASLPDGGHGNLDLAAPPVVVLSAAAVVLSVAAPAPAAAAAAAPADPGPPAPAPPPSFCEPDTLGGLLRQFALRGEGADSGVQLNGLLAYYRRLGCSPAQIQDAMAGLQPPALQHSEAAGTTSAASPAGFGSGSGAASAPFTARRVMVVGSDGEVSDPVWGLRGGWAQQLQLAGWELLAAAVAAAALAAWQSRPRGWSRKDLLEVRSSAISGRGVFALAPIPGGTVLGAYPGRLRTAAEMVGKCGGAPLAASYAFRTADGRFLDPTDASGQPSPYPQPGWPWPLPTDVVLSYVNEPPKLSPGTNATVEDGSHPGELLFVAATDIPEGAEVLIDYGITYDRSEYGRSR